MQNNLIEKDEIRRIYEEKLEKYGKMEQIVMMSSIQQKKDKKEKIGRL